MRLSSILPDNWHFRFLLSENGSKLIFRWPYYSISLNSNNPNSTGSPCNEQNSFKDVEYWESQFPFGISELRNSDYPISYLCVEKVKRIVQSNQRIWTLFCQCVSFTNRCRFWSQKGQSLKYNNNYSNNDSNQPFRIDLAEK